MRISNDDPVREEYARLAGGYDDRWSSYIGGTVRETIKRINARPGDRVLDIGCGTGVLLQALSNAVPGLKLFGVDPSPEMLAQAERRMPPAVVFATGSAESLPILDASIDIVVSTSAFHYFREPQLALSEMRRVLKVDGRLVITDWCHDYLTCRLCDIYLHLLNRAHYHAYGTAECAQMLRDAGMEDVAVESYRINWFWGLMTATARKGSDPSLDGP